MILRDFKSSLEWYSQTWNFYLYNWQLTFISITLIVYFQTFWNMRLISVQEESGTIPLPSTDDKTDSYHCSCKWKVFPLYIYIYIYIYNFLLIFRYIDLVKNLVMIFCFSGWRQNVLRKSLTRTAQECYELYWTNPGSNTLRNISCTATYPHPNKRKKTSGSLLEKQVMFSYGPLHMDMTVARPTRIYLQQLLTRCGLEGLPGAMDVRDEWRERERVWEICASSVTWWLWW